MTVKRLAIALIKGGFPLTLALTSGCGSIKEAPPAPEMMRAEQFLTRRLEDPQLHSFIQKMAGSGPSTQWDFKSLYWASLYFNPVLAEAKATLTAARSAEVTAGQRRNPVFSFSPSLDTSAMPNVWLLGVGLSVPVETNGKRDLRLAASQAQALATAYRLIGTAWDVRSQVLNSLVDLHIARESVRRNHTLLTTQSAIVTEYDKRTSQGQMPSAFASQAHVNYQQTSLQLEQARTDIDQAEVKLAGALGVSVAAIKAVQVNEILPQADTGNPAPREIILRQHPAILESLAAFDAAHQLLKLEVAKQTPDIDIGPGYEWNSQHGGKFTLGISFTLPIANKNEGPIAEADANRIVAARHFETVQAAIINQIEQAQTAYKAANREQISAHGIIKLQEKKELRLRNTVTQRNAAALPLLYAKNDVQTAAVAELASYAKLLRTRAALEDAIRQPLFGGVIDDARLTQESR